MSGQSWEAYKGNLYWSDIGVEAVAKWLWELGYTINKPKLKVAPSAEQAKHYGDRGDLHILIDNKWREIDVKYRTYHGGQITAWKTIIMGKTRVINNRPKPFMHITIDKSCHWAFVVHPYDTSLFSVSEYTGSDEERAPNYEAPAEIIRLNHIPSADDPIGDLDGASYESAESKLTLHLQRIEEVQGIYASEIFARLAIKHAAAREYFYRTGIWTIGGEGTRRLEQRSTGHRQHSETDNRRPRPEVPVQRQHSILDHPAEKDRPEGPGIHRDPHAEGS